MKVTVSRTHWLRGNPSTSMLRNHEGEMCCLGFYGICAGVHPKKMVEVYEPNELPFIVDGLSLLTEDEDGEDLCLNSPFASEAIEINDNEKMPDREREERLIELFKKNGHELEFVP